jgi:hypothetical protein
MYLESPQCQRGSSITGFPFYLTSESIEGVERSFEGVSAKFPVGMPSPSGPHRRRQLESNFVGGGTVARSFYEPVGSVDVLGISGDSTDKVDGVQ